MRSLSRSRFRLPAALVAVALLAGGVVAGASPEALEIVPVGDFGAGDGLSRFVVELADPPAASVPFAPGSSGPSALGAVELSAAQDLLGAEGSLLSLGGRSFYVTDVSGVDVSPGSELVVVPIERLRERFGDALPAGDPALELLAGAPGVVSAQRLPDGRVLVAGKFSEVDVERLPGVTGVEESVSVPVLGYPSDPYWAQYGWNLENTGSNAYQQAALEDADADVSAAWDVTQGQSMVVAVTDTGFDIDHPDLQGALWVNPDQPCNAADSDGNGKVGDCHGWNFYTNSPDVENGAHGSHGTSVSGVVAARANNGVGSAGVAPQAKVMPLVIGGGSSVDVNLAAAAIRYAVDNGADVINASWGGAFTGAPLQALRDAVAYAAENDVLVVAASGNDGLDRDASILYPASLPDANVFTVGSSTASDTVTPSSAYGAKNVDVFAPGNLVATTWFDGSTRLVGGTSIAAPHVAAAVALYGSVFPELSALELKARVMEDADPVPAFAGRSVSGARLSLASLAPPSEVSFLFSRMSAPAGMVSPQVVASAPAGQGSYSVEVSLAMEHEGAVWAVADVPVVLDGVSRVTDDRGAARFSLGSRTGVVSAVLAPKVTLAEGRYALVVQLFKDGSALSRPYAAPLLVGPVGETPGGGSAPGGGGSPAPGGTPPGGSPAPGGGSPAPGGTPPGGGSPAPGGGGTPPGGGTSPGGSSPTPSVPAPPSSPPGGEGAPTPPEEGSPMPSVPAPGSPPPGGGSPAPGGTPPGGGSPSPAPGGGSPAPAPGGGAPTPPEGGSAPTPPAAPPGGGSKEYPGVGDFRLTSISPVRISVAGGTVVTIEGEALPADPGVRVGATGVGRVVSHTATRLMFVAPARVAGVYDVTVYDNGRYSTLPAALEYFEDEVSTPPGGGGSPAPGGTPPGGGSPAPGGTPPGGGSAPKPPSAPGGTPPGTPPPGNSPGGPALPPASTSSGPNGERLVRYEPFASLAAVWSLNCSTSCAGMQV